MDQSRTHTTTTNPSAGRNRPRRRIAFIEACWHREIVERAREGFLDRWAGLGGAADEISLHEVPGSFEIPLLAQHLTASGTWDAVVAAGFVIDGGIYRHEFVAETVIGALMRVQLDSQVPVISAVLTPHAFHEHDVHRGFFADHFLTKGREAAEACDRIVATLAKVRAAA